MNNFEIGKLYAFDKKNVLFWISTSLMTTLKYITTETRATKNHGNIFLYIGKSKVKNTLENIHYECFYDVKYSRIVEPIILELNSFVLISN